MGGGGAAFGSADGAFVAAGGGVERIAGAVDGVAFVTGGFAVLSGGDAAFCGAGVNEVAGTALVIDGPGPLLGACTTGATFAFVATILDRGTVVVLLICVVRKLLFPGAASSFCRFWAVARTCCAWA